MITDNQWRKLMKNLSDGETLGVSALRSGMDVKTARKYRDLSKSPSELGAESRRTWRTRRDPFEGVWEQVKSFLNNNAGLEAKTLFEYLQRKNPGSFQDGQLRTFQRKVKHWRATEGPAREVFFPQVHRPGRLSQSDFTHMGFLGITIDGVFFDHLIYHFVLTYSNWETGCCCFLHKIVRFFLIILTIFSDYFEQVPVDGTTRGLWVIFNYQKASFSLS